MPGRSLCKQHGQELRFRELVPSAAFLKPRTCRSCQCARVSFRLPRVSPRQISKWMQGDYMLSGTQKTQPFAFDMLLGKSNPWFSNICVLWAACSSFHSCTGAVAQGWYPSAFQPGGHTDQGDFASGALQDQSPRFSLFATLTVLVVASRL